jgi:hypothetical protein
MSAFGTASGISVSASNALRVPAVACAVGLIAEICVRVGSSAPMKWDSGTVAVGALRWSATVSDD